MSAPSNLNLTVEASYQQNYPYAIVVGGKRMQPPAGPLSNGYWFLVLDRVSLNPVVNIFATSYNTVPSQVTQYDDDKHILIVVSVALLTMHYPQGPLYDFLLKHGGGAQLRRLAQVITDLGCGNIAFVCYTLVSVLGPGDFGFDQSALAGEPAPLMTLQLMPVDVGGTYYYTPIALSN